MPSFVHKSVLVAEVLASLEPHPGGCYADGTVGGGGHAEAILRASSPDGRLFGCDQDEAAVQAATGRLKVFAGRYEIRHGDFASLPTWVGSEACDGVLLDLGVSSAQLDQAERGFSFQRDGALDMRMNQNQSQTAAQYVNEASADELARLFWEFGGEREARRIARAIAEARGLRRFETTLQLAALVERVVPRRGQKVHPATRVFQALRMAVNDELGALQKGLPAVWKLLKPGARLAVITFHSVEDRVVKRFGRELARDYLVEGDVDVPELRQPAIPRLRWVQRKAIRASAAEVLENPRARSAQLRVMEKL